MDEERIKAAIFFHSVDNSNNLCRHHLKLFKPRWKTNARQKFFNNRAVNEWNRLPADVIRFTTVNIFKNCLELVHQLQVQVSFSSWKETPWKSSATIHPINPNSNPNLNLGTESSKRNIIGDSVSTYVQLQ